MKLPFDVPEEAVYFLAGSLPFAAILHLRCLSLFGMICNLPDNIIYRVANMALLTALPAHRSLFLMIRDVCLQYGLQHPLLSLEHPLPPSRYKSVCKEKVYEYWHSKFALRCLDLSSLRYFQPYFLSLSRTHPIWSSLDGSPYQSKAAHVQALLLTGRYRTERLKRFWTPKNRVKA